MARHERGCTANPTRTCGVCRQCELDEARPLPELIAFCKANAVVDDSVGGDPDDSSLFLEEAGVKALRELAGQCPVCMLAALRQSDVYARSGFDMKKELASLWADHNEEQMARERGYG